MVVPEPSLTNQFPRSPNLGKHGSSPPPPPHSQDGSDVGLLRGSQELMTEAITSSAAVTSNEFSGQCQIRPSILRQKLLSPNYGRIRQIRFLPREKSDLSVCCCGRMNYSACYYGSREVGGGRLKELQHAITRESVTGPALR